MKNTHRKMNVRMLAAMLVAVAVIILSSLAAHAPAQNQSSLTLKSIRTDNTAVFYANRRPTCAWFVEACREHPPKLRLVCGGGPSNRRQQRDD